MDFDLYEVGSVWTGTKVRGAVAQLDAPMTCKPWNVRTLLNTCFKSRGTSWGLHGARRRFAPLDSQASSRRRGTVLGNVFGDQLIQLENFDVSGMIDGSIDHSQGLVELMSGLALGPPAT